MSVPRQPGQPGQPRRRTAPHPLLRVRLLRARPSSVALGFFSSSSSYLPSCRRRAVPPPPPCRRQPPTPARFLFIVAALSSPVMSSSSSSSSSEKRGNAAGGVVEGSRQVITSYHIVCVCLRAGAAGGRALAPYVAQGCTELRKSLGRWLREISSCSCLTFLPGPAWLLLNKICTPFSRSLYFICFLMDARAKETNQ